MEAMRTIHTKPCADLLFNRLKRVKSSNTTRRYLATVIKLLSTMPSELVEEGFRGTRRGQVVQPEDEGQVPGCPGETIMDHRKIVWVDFTL